MYRRPPESSRASAQVRGEVAEERGLLRIAFTDDGSQVDRANQRRSHQQRCFLRQSHRRVDIIVQPADDVVENPARRSSDARRSSCDVRVALVKVHW